MIQNNLLKGEVKKASSEVDMVYKLAEAMNGIALNDSFSTPQKEAMIITLSGQIMALTQGL